MTTMRTAVVFALSLCLPSIRLCAQTPDRESLEFLHRLEQAGGGYAPNLQPASARSSLRATAAAVRALR